MPCMGDPLHIGQEATHVAGGGLKLFVPLLWLIYGPGVVSVFFPAYTHSMHFLEE